MKKKIDGCFYRKSIMGLFLFYIFCFLIHIACILQKNIYFAES